MRTPKPFLLIGLIIAFSVIFQIAAVADEWTEETSISFNQDVQIPGQVLPAGTYVFKLAEPSSSRSMVEVFNADQSKLLATLQTVPTIRPQPAGDVLVTVADEGSGRNDALVSWFYPGETAGHTFIYPKRLEKQLAQDTKHVFVGNKGAAAVDTVSGD